MRKLALVRAQKLALVGAGSRQSQLCARNSSEHKGVAERAYQPGISDRNQVTIRCDWLVQPNASRFLNQIF